MCGGESAFVIAMTIKWKPLWLASYAKEINTKLMS
jgi:hypothetical protein